MKTFISILRGINVGGVTIKMDALRKAYEELGFENVKSYIQSGNLFFNYPETDLQILNEMISGKIKEVFGYQIQLQVLTSDRVRKVIDENPFPEDPKLLHITFLAEPALHPDLGAIENKKQSSEQILVTDDAVYLYCPDGYGKTNLHTNFLESKLKVKATTRNWKTTDELLKIALEMEEK